MKYVLIFLGIVALAILWSLLMTFPMLWIWNTTIVDLFQLPLINYLDMFKLSLLISLLFGSSGISSKS